jgi:hypothetical protein
MFKRMMGSSGSEQLARLLVDRRALLASIAASAASPSASSAGSLAATAPTLGDGSVHTARPVPDIVNGVAQCALDINGEWMLCASLPPSFDGSALDALSWVPTIVPGELAMQGVKTATDVAYALRRRIPLPHDFVGRAMVLRFDGVYNHARVWVNGRQVREHFGGFTSWDCDVTDFILGADELDLVVLLVDRADDPSGASSYVKHSIAGILRDVRLIALPKTHVSQWQVSASLDESCRIGLLDVGLAVVGVESRSVKASVSLRDPGGREVPLNLPNPLSIDSKLAFPQVRLPDVERWDSEHPNLYELSVELVSKSGSQTLRRKIGFRRIDHQGNQILVNGDPIILRGVCRHDTHPTRGRSPGRIFDEQDPELLAAANINFVRTSHYPPGEAFLATCDRVGIYVEEESAAAFLTGPQASDPALRSRMVGQLSEMISRDHWHASVLIWSLGNESEWGDNYRAELKTVCDLDSSRPTIFSWPENMGLDRRNVDIFSSHYPLWDSNLGSSDYPVLHDEFAHIPCYNLDDLKRDPGIRNFWGHSIERFADAFYDTPGCVGGSIWACFDDVFLLPDERIVGFGPWGILDGWRRPKPEYWLTRNAFSPIRIKMNALSSTSAGDPLEIPVRNCYNHTNLSALTFTWRLGDQAGKMSCPDVKPHQSGVIRLPILSGQEGEIVSLFFSDAGGKEVDRFELVIGRRRVLASSPLGATLVMREKTDLLEISGRDFSISIDRSTGLILQGFADGQLVVEGGPFLDLGTVPQLGWELKTIEWKRHGTTVVVRTQGQSRFLSRTMPVYFEYEIYGDGCLDLRYALTEKPAVQPHHLGIGLTLPAGIDRLCWDRRAQWSNYPEDHIGRPRGTASRYSARSKSLGRDRPAWPWREDVWEPAINGYVVPANAATNDFRSFRENIYWAACLNGAHDGHIRVEADGDVAVKAAPTASDRIDLLVYHHWNFPDLNWGNYCGKPSVSEMRQMAPPPNCVRFRLTHKPAPWRRNI